MSIRMVAHSDVHALARVQVAAWQRAYVGIIPERYLEGYTEQMRREAWTRHLAQPTEGISTFVWESARGVEGFVCVRCVPDACELMALYVHPDAWGEGVGHALHEHAIRELNASEHARAFLWVLADNTRATTFYTRHGWQRDDQSKHQDYAGESVEQHLYTRSVSDS